MLILFIFLGLIFGSFLNVLIHRLPLQQSIVFPSSYCPHCQKDINWFYNIPLISFFIERIIGEMKKVDSTDVKNGKIDESSVIDCIINKNGPAIREIIIKNYRQKERLDEIINTATWSLTRMLENSTK